LRDAAGEDAMDDSRLDHVARLLGRAADRRSLAGAAAALVFAGALPAAARSGRTGCIRDGERCGKHAGDCSRCCSKFSLYDSNDLIPTGRRHCACRPEGMPCQRNAQCCQGVCNPDSGTCDDGQPGGEPIVCDSGVNFCQSAAQNCGGTSSCWCVNTNQGDVFCTNGQFNCASNFGANITCNDDNDCFNRYGSGACVAMSDCGANVACSGGTACAQICPN
jgi:hypothetical protein